MEAIKLQRGPLLEIEGTQTKGGGWHSYSKEPVRDKAAEDAGLAAGGGDTASVGASSIASVGTRTNSAGDSHC